MGLETQIYEIDDRVDNIYKVITVLSAALLEKEQYGQLSSETINKLEMIAK